MGLFDYVRCDYPLPGNPPAWATEFQTKDLTCYMMHYTITADGRLVEESDKEEYSEFTGAIEFYTSNVVGSGPGLYTDDGDDAHYLEYRSDFVDGRLTKIQELVNKREPAVKSPGYSIPSLTVDEREQINKRRSESLVGRTMYVWWGGSASGYTVTVVGENARQWVVESPSKGFQLIHRSDRDRIIFDSYEDGQRDRNERAAEWERRRQEFEAGVKAKLFTPAAPAQEAE